MLSLVYNTQRFLYNHYIVHFVYNGYVIFCVQHTTFSMQSLYNEFVIALYIYIYMLFILIKIMYTNDFDEKIDLIRILYYSLRAPTLIISLRILLE